VSTDSWGDRATILLSEDQQIGKQVDSLIDKVLGFVDLDFETPEALPVKEFSLDQ